MFRLITLIAIVALAEGIPFSKLPWMNPMSPSGQIVGGREAAIEEAPHQVLLEVSGFAFCGGSIISKDWVVTAGHCTVYPAAWVTVRAGTAAKSQGGSVHKVGQVVRHEEFYTNSYGIPVNDVALLKVKTPFTFDKTRAPVKMFEQDEVSQAGVKATITGWGAAYQGGDTTPVLKIVDIPIVAKGACSEAYSSYGGIPKGQICAAYPEGGADACQGDSGGPLTIGGRLAGIVSWGYGCAKPGFPGVHTEVAANRDWIKSKVGF
ncbi:hypothetical protein KM043_001070 [Ampulex compressa]|nr:hypothetical protein KM043_001070 [Ampulex compressa]